MELSEQNVLFFSRSTQHGGTENVILQLCEIFKPYVNKIVICSAAGFNKDKLKKLGIIHYEIPDIENKRVETVLAVCKTIKKIYRKEKITVIHTHCRMAAFYIQILGLYKHCFFINTSHTVFFDKKVLNRYVYKNAHKIACGEMVKKNLSEFYGIKEVEVIHNAVKPFEDEMRVDPGLAQMKTEGYFLIGNVSRLSKEKGVEYFISAIPMVLECRKDVRFFIIGSGQEEHKLKRMCDDLGIDGVVVFMGYRTDIQNVIKQMDLMVLSSLMEGLPLTPIETYSTGKTIVATAVDGTVEIVRDGVDGYLVEPGNSRAIADKIIHLIEHPEIRKQMEKAALQRYKEEFSFDKLAKSYIEYYEKL